MRTAHSLLVGASYFSLFQTQRCCKTIYSLTFHFQNMATSTTADPTATYTPGTSSVAFVTTPDEASAKKIAHALIEKKLAACVNIVPQITSIYQWEGKVNEDTEVLMMIKTQTNRTDELAKFVRDNHPYSVAEVITLPIENGNPPYMDWIAKSVLEKK